VIYLNDSENSNDLEDLTKKEIQAILKSSKGNKPIESINLNIGGKHIKYGYFSDCHIGHNKFILPLWDLMTKYFKTEKVEFVVDAGDHLEGMSNRPGHIYELTHIGFKQQIDFTEELYKMIRVPIYGIDGNHDEWYFKKSDVGLIVGEELQKRIPNYTHLGQMEGDLQLTDNVKLKLFHANDGTAYAISYKLQKLIESFTGGEKPNIVHSGHYHKSFYMFLRNIHGFECGTLCGQSKWMRGKKIPAHIGFGIVDLWIDNNGINKLRHEFVPYYERK
jgi:predicted phosphodiesterase